MDSFAVNESVRLPQRHRTTENGDFLFEQQLQLRVCLERRRDP